MTDTVTYVEMTNPGQLNPGTVVPGLTLTNADERLGQVSEVLARIGAPYGWRSANRSPQEWQASFAEHPGRTCWHPPGMGSGAGTRRVWLHTSSADNPHALPNYHRRGFRTFKTEEHDS